MDFVKMIQLKETRDLGRESGSRIGGICDLNVY
jgi:hypothetical protein